MEESPQFIPPQNTDPDREEVLRLRKLRKEQAKAEKQSEIDAKVREITLPLVHALSARNFDAGILAGSLESIIDKLKYYLQKNPETLDPNTLADAIVDSPHCISDPNCGISGLLKAHEMKTLERIAEIRKNKAEYKGGEELNPYEALFETDSGEYYMARLLNMPHLKEESAFMNHCVGTSDSYINKMKRGDIEILSFRKSPKINPETNQFEGDEPIMTIEYDVRSKSILQIKKKSDEYLNTNDSFFEDFVEALGKLKESETDTGDKRDFQSINPLELNNIKVEDYYVYTEKGSIPFEKYDEKEHGFILKDGSMFIDANTDKYFALKILKFKLGIDLAPNEFAQDRSEVNEKTRLFIGSLYSNIFKELPQTLEHIYTKFPEQ